jgi:hypothetical protein
MQVTNIGVIVKNNYGDTLPVSLTQETVEKIKHILGQMPTVADNKVLGLDGKPVASRATIPIIPRKMAFDWDYAYAEMTNEEKQEAFTELMAGYAELSESEGIVNNAIEEVLKNADDPLNPFEMKLNASGRANVDIEEKDELAITEEDKNPERKDETVEVENLNIGAKTPNPGE